MIQFELDHTLDQHQHWIANNRLGSRADFTGRNLKQLDAAERDFTGAIFDGANVFDCDFKGANLTDIVANGAHFMETDFTDANLRNAHLPKVKFSLCTFHNTDLWDVSGDGVHIISLQLGGKNVCYTSEILQINCMQYDIKDIWWMPEDDLASTVKGHSEVEVAEMMQWWEIWQYQIYQIVNKQPAKPVNSPK